MSVTLYRSTKRVTWVTGIMASSLRPEVSSPRRWAGRSRDKVQNPKSKAQSLQFARGMWLDGVCWLRSSIKRISFGGADGGTSSSPGWVMVAVRRFFGPGRRAGEIIVPLLILEARNEKNPPGGKIFSASLTSDWWSKECSCSFFHWIWTSAEFFAAWNPARRRARRLRRLAMVWTLSFNFRASAWAW